MRLDAEGKDQQRRHQGTATHAGQTHDQTDKKARKDEDKIMHGRDCSGRPSENKRYFCYTLMGISLCLRNGLRNGLRNRLRISSLSGLRNDLRRGLPVRAGARLSGCDTGLEAPEGR